MTNPLINPFDPRREPDRHGFWQMLVARDCDAFMAADWSLVDDDFAADRFEGISANGSMNPDAWTLTYPTVASYRDDWLRMSADYRRTPLATDDHRTLLYQMTTLARVEIAADRAAIWKRFTADVPLRDGDRLRISAQSIYRLHRVDGRWRIAGFVGYLPLEARA